MKTQFQPISFQNAVLINGGATEDPCDTACAYNQGKNVGTVINTIGKGIMTVIELLAGV